MPSIASILRTLVYEALKKPRGTPSPRRGERGYLGNQRARSSSLTSAADARFDGGDSTTTRWSGTGCSHDGRRGGSLTREKSKSVSRAKSNKSPFGSYSSLWSSSAWIAATPSKNSSPEPLSLCGNQIYGAFAATSSPRNDFVKSTRHTG